MATSALEKTVWLVRMNKQQKKLKTPDLPPVPHLTQFVPHPYDGKPISLLHLSSFGSNDLMCIYPS